QARGGRPAPARPRRQSPDVTPPATAGRPRAARAAPKGPRSRPVRRRTALDPRSHPRPRDGPPETVQRVAPGVGMRQRVTRAVILRAEPGTARPCPTRGPRPTRARGRDPEPSTTSCYGIPGRTPRPGRLRRLGPAL